MTTSPETYIDPELTDESTFVEKPKEIDSVVISGGGIHGLSLIGALQAAIDRNIFQVSNIDTFVGTSIGSIICYLLCIGMYPMEIIYDIIKHRHELDKLTLFNLVNMLNLEGGVSISHFQHVLERVTLERTGTLFTMKSLYEKYNRTLVCVTFNYTTKEIEYVSHANYPDLPCIIACMMSSSIPIIFEKCIYNDQHYIDGGVYDNFAIQHPFALGKMYPIGFNVMCGYTKCQPHEKFYIYMYELYKICITAVGSNKCEIFKDRAKIINIPIHSDQAIWWNTNDIIGVLDMFSYGYNFMNEPPPPPPPPVQSQPSPDPDLIPNPLPSAS